MSCTIRHGLSFLENLSNSQGNQQKLGTITEIQFNILKRFSLPIFEFKKLPWNEKFAILDGYHDKFGKKLYRDQSCV